MSETVECCICMENINDDQNKVITKCKHIFCLTCILNHYEEKNNCPLCREILVNEDDNVRKFQLKINFDQLSSIYISDSVLDDQLDHILLPQVINIVNKIRDHIDTLRVQQILEHGIPSDNRHMYEENQVHVPRQRRRQTPQRLQSSEENQVRVPRQRRRQRQHRQPKCSLCSQTGHNRRTCQMRRMQEDIVS